ncbi:glycoside hydrolase family 25 protein [Xylanibacter muris]|uniref:Glycoside hydrolase family 25 protein n=1 Tax=Xylanibacter muris TaxID=2736290 RepID=A0ABX2AND4_9BACT|nr:glycoside hydrolase family 25 protein [Xylanibacter muris]NPD92704.1 glycoside hydrolase family 25 protein [Xylanibacter muris]
MPATTKNNNKRKSNLRRSRKNPVRKRKHGLFTGILGKLPGWAWWSGGGLVVAVYVWAFYYFFVSPFGFRWRALYGDASYPKGYEIHGIDISHYQGKIDWESLKNNGMIEKCPVRFVMIKATEGRTRVDKRFNDNFYNAREYGFIRGAYHFWSTRSSGRAQAEHFIRNVRLEEGDLPPVLDVEHKSKEQSPEEFKESVLTWLRLVEKEYKVKPIIYTYYKFKTTYLSDEVFDEYPYWIAHYYVDKVKYEGKWKFWQHTDCGRLPGIQGFVDFNIYNGSYYDLRRLTIGGD